MSAAELEARITELTHKIAATRAEALQREADWLREHEERRSTPRLRDASAAPYGSDSPIRECRGCGEQWNTDEHPSCPYCWEMDKAVDRERAEVA
ncbi:MAG: hypothetical protein RI885_2290 [Actinomycetota bacterium]|jgi:rubrerythrin